jgi:hypothetical protein
MRAPLYLDVWATVHGSTLGSLHPGRALRSGDRIRLEARTSLDADVYLVHCDDAGTASVYPETGAIRVRSDQRVSLPAAGIDLRLDNAPGHETFYVVATNRALDAVDPSLHELFAQARSEEGAGCGPELDEILSGSTRAPRLARARDGTERVEARFALRGIELSDLYYTQARALADDDGIVVLRFAVVHQP